MIAELEWEDLNNLSVFHERGGLTYIASFRDDLHVLLNPKKVGEYGVMYVGEEERTFYYLAYQLRRAHFLYLIPLWKYKYEASIEEIIPVLKSLMFNCKEINAWLPARLKVIVWNLNPNSFYEQFSDY